MIDMQLTGAQIVIKKLLEHNIRIVFEFPGGSICSILDELRRIKKIRTVVFRHEQAAIHAADAYARITKRPSICMATSGPGASNLVTGIANAFMDSVPIVIITGQVAVWDLKKDRPVRQRGFQELDIVSVVRTITKAAFLVNKVSDLATVIDKAFFIAQQGRPGPVLVDIPINLQYTCCASNKYTKLNLKWKKPNCAKSVIREITKRLVISKRPLVLAGGGVILSSATEELAALLKNYQLPVAQTLMGLTSVPYDYELNLGFVGYAGSRVSNSALKKADFILGLGLRFDNRAFPGGNKELSPTAYIVHVDCDKNEFNHRIVADKTVFADAKLFLKELLAELKNAGYKPKHEWIKTLRSWIGELGLQAAQAKSGLTPESILNRLSALLRNKKTIITTDVGQHQLWTAQYFKFNRPNSLVTSGGLGTMGFGLPAAIGAQLAEPKAAVFNITSDGSFQMNIQELATVKDYKLPLKIILLNNKCLGLVRQIQEFAFCRRYVSTRLNASVDFVKIALAYGIDAFSVKRPAQIKNALNKLLASKKSVLIDFRINEFENVYPIRIKGKVIYCRAKP